MRFGLIGIVVWFRGRSTVQMPLGPKTQFIALKSFMAAAVWLALDDLDRLQARERAQILRKIERLQHGLRGDLKRLHLAEAMYRLRMGDYRVLFDVIGTTIMIRQLGDRKDVYD